MNKWFTVSALAMSVALGGCLGSSSSSSKSNSDSDVGQETPAPELTPSSIALSPLGRYESGVYGLSAAEIPAYDHINQQIFMVNAREGAVDVLNAEKPDDLLYVDTLSVDDLPGLTSGSTVNSIAFHDDGKDGLLAVAIENATKTDNGYAALYNARTLEPLGHVTVGAQPDNLTFTPDGKYLLTANEGEPSVEYNFAADGDPESVREVYRVDPEGSVSVISIEDGKLGEVRTAGFESFNSRKDELIEAGVRIFGPANNHQPYSATNIASVARDMEPEYLAISGDSKTAWVSLQENNALARIDIASASVTDIFPLLYKDHGLERNAADFSDGDREQCTAEQLGDPTAECAQINIRTWPGVVGMYHPDSIAAYDVGGKTYIVTANEGDARAWGEEFGGLYGDEESNDLYFSGDNTHRPTGFIEEWRVKHLVHNSGFGRRAGDDLPMHLRDLAAGAMLNPEVFEYCGATATRSGDCRDDFSGMGRLLVSWVDGYQKRPDGSPVLYDASTGEQDDSLTAADSNSRLMYDQLYAFGGRSFAIWDGDTGEQVFDSGAHMELLIANQEEQARAIVPHLDENFECRLGSDRQIPCARYFNSNHSHGDSMDRRSVNKGLEPEGVTVGQLGDKTYAFIGIERMGGVMAYDVSNPSAPIFVDYLNTREDWDLKPEDNLDLVGDLGAEGVFFVPADQSPNEEPLLIMGHEVSGTTTVFQIDREYE